MASVEGTDVDERETLRMERLEFLLSYIRWVRSVPNKEWSGQQAVLVNASLRNASNLQISAVRYLELNDGRKRKVPVA